MKKLMLLIGVSLVLAGVASADQCGGANNVLVGGYTCEVNGLQFSNFSALNAQNTPVPVVIAVNSYIDPDGTVHINFNPDFGGATPQDIYFLFTVTGLNGTLINGIDLFVGGVGASINETACSSAFNLGFECTGNVLANISQASQDPNESAFFAPIGQIFIFKDIRGVEDGHLTNFNQSFHVPVPEPATMTLFGAGLIGLGRVLRRKLAA